MASPSAPAITQIKLLDERLIAGIAGQDSLPAGWAKQRELLVQQVLREHPDLADLAELRDRTSRLEDQLLHWRRTSMMELSLIDQHLRYLHAQHPDSARVPARINVSG
jgi:hypothetical protein